MVTFYARTLTNRRAVAVYLATLVAMEIEIIFKLNWIAKTFAASFKVSFTSPGSSSDEPPLCKYS